MLSSRMFRYSLNLVLLLSCVILVTGFARANKSAPEQSQVDQTQVADGKLPEEVVHFFPKATKVYEEKGVRTIVVDSKDKKLGFLLYTSPYSDSVEGYNGPTPVAIAFDTEGRIMGTMMLENAETPSFALRVEKKGLFDSWTGKTAEEALAQEVDAVSGATYTSTSVITSVQKRLEVYIGQKKKKKLTSGI